MTPSDWISVGALMVAAVSVIVSGVLAPRIAARIATDQRTREERIAVYADTARLTRARVQEIDEESYGWPAQEAGPDSDETSRITARLVLLGSPTVRRIFVEFFGAYWSAGRLTLHSHSAHAQGQDNIAARFEIGRIADRMKILNDQLIAAMQHDIGVEAIAAVTQRPANGGT